MSALTALLRVLELSQRDVARATGLSQPTVHRITHGVWPRRGVRAARQALEACLRERGATPDQLQNLFATPENLLVSGVPAPKTAPEVPTVETETPEEEKMLLPKQTPTDEAREKFRIAFRNPFDGEVTCDAEMFINGDIQYAHQAAWQAAIGGGVVAVVGESGAGKTTMLDGMREKILRERLPVVCIAPSVAAMEESDSRGRMLKTADLYMAIAYALDKRARVPQNAQRRSQVVLEMLEKSTIQGNQHLLIIEEAHATPTVTLNQLKRLNEEMRLGRRYMLGVLLLGHPELEKKLTRHDVRESMQRTSIVRLAPLGANLSAYLQHRAAAAGRGLEEFITPDGVDELKNRLTVHRGGRAAPLSMLYPLNVNNWMTLALNTAAALGAPRIDRDVVRVANPDGLVFGG